MIKNNSTKEILFIITYWVVYFFLFKSTIKLWWKHLDVMLTDNSVNRTHLVNRLLREII